MLGSQTSFWDSGFWTWGGWSFFVAVGTLLLALTTAALAGFTLKAVRESQREVTAVDRQATSLAEQTGAVKEQAAATRRQVDVSVASLEAASRPVLVGLVTSGNRRPVPVTEAMYEMIPLRFSDGQTDHIWPESIFYRAAEDKIYCSIPLRNVGAGVAFIQRTELVVTRNEFPLTGRVTDPIVPRDEVTRTLFAAVRKQSDGSWSDWEEITGEGGRGFAEFTIRVVYTGASKELVTVTEITTTQVPDGGYIYTAQQVWSGEGADRQLLVSTDNIGT